MIEDIQRKFNIALEPDNFFGIVKNYCLICEYFTLDNDKYCEKKMEKCNTERCEGFKYRSSLKEALNG